MTDTIDGIRARHEAWDEMWQLYQAMSPKTSVDPAHTDRATLLRLLDAAREELVEISTWTGDDQRELIAAVADTMLYYDDKPIDFEEAAILTDALKIYLQDNGFQIVRLATCAQGESS